MDNLIDIIKNHPDQVNALAALCALLVSFLSILLTVYTSWLQRRHNFKSLTPIASITTSDYEDKLEVKLKNTGIGPLIVERFTTYDGNEEKGDIISWMPSLPEGTYWSTFSGNIDGRCIPSSQDAILIQLNGDPSSRDFALFRDEVRCALSKLTVKVKYRDIYNRKMPIKEQNLKWFARHLPEQDVLISKKKA